MTINNKQLFNAQNTVNEAYSPPSLGKSLIDIFRITGTSVDFSELSKQKDKKRLFQDEKGTFMEQEKKQKGKKTIAE